MQSTLTWKSAAIGFMGALFLTILAFLAVIQHWFNGYILGVLILGLAILQLIVQILFLVDTGTGSGKKWNLAAFISTLVLILIIVMGSIWIMYHLNYNMMASPSLMRQYIQNQQGF